MILIGPSLDVIQHLHIVPIASGPELNTVLKMWPQQCQVQADDRLPVSAGHNAASTSQDAISFLGHLGTLLTHIQLTVNQHSQVLLQVTAF